MPVLKALLIKMFKVFFVKFWSFISGVITHEHECINHSSDLKSMLIKTSLSDYRSIGNCFVVILGFPKSVYLFTLRLHMMIVGVGFSSESRFYVNTTSEDPKSTQINAFCHST